MTNTSNPRNLKELLARLQELGCELEVGRHIKVRLNGRLVATLAKTTGDRRSILNAVSNLRRAGVCVRLMEVRDV